MPKIIDLHTHSTASDGDDSPSHLVHAVLRANVDVFALTDHDTLSGISEAANAVQNTGTTMVPGIELSAQVIDPFPDSKPRSVHLLGYLVDLESPELLDEIEKIRTHRADRLEKMVQKLSADFDLSWEEVQHSMPIGATPGRPHIAQVLVDRGYFRNTSEAFDGPLRANSPYHVPHYAPSLRLAIKLVIRAGGVPVLAHPFTDGRSGPVDHRKTVEEITSAYSELAALGLAGLEIEHRENTEKGKKILRAVASELNLIVTGSSDYHGTKKPNALAENTTKLSELNRILELGSGSEPVS